jgi:hypothetical protein
MIGLTTEAKQTQGDDFPVLQMDKLSLASISAVRMV